MDRTGDLIDLTTAGSADCSTVTVECQWTNNLDGLLRDHNGNVIPLDSREFRHQAYFKDQGSYHGYVDCPARYVFKGGKLHKIEHVVNLQQEVFI